MRVDRFSMFIMVVLSQLTLIGGGIGMQGKEKLPASWISAFRELIKLEDPKNTVHIYLYVCKDASKIIRIIKKNQNREIIQSYILSKAGTIINSINDNELIISICNNNECINYNSARYELFDSFHHSPESRPTPDTLIDVVTGGAE